MWVQSAWLTPSKVLMSLAFQFNQDWLNPEIKTNGWAMVAAAVVGWSNNGTILSVSAYCLYW